MIKLKAILVLGSARNGTTWLSNRLSNHSLISCPRHQLHYGYHECDVYRINKYFNFKDTDKFIKFLEIYSASDYFNLARGEKHKFYKNRPNNFYELLFRLLNNFAKKNNSKYWLLKIDPRLYLYREEWDKFISLLYDNVEEIKFVSIKRNIVDVIKSYLKMPGKNYEKRNRFVWRYFAIILQILRYNNHYYNISDIISENSGYSIKFSNFKKNHQISLKKLINYLDLKYEEDLTNKNFKKNTSHLDKTNSIKKLSQKEKKFLLKINKIFKKTPMINKKILQYYETKKNTQPSLYFRLLKNKYMSETLKKELDETGNYLIKELIKNDKK